MRLSTLSWTERGGDGGPGSLSALPLSVASRTGGRRTIRLVDHNQSGDWYAKATPAIDPLLERHPTGSKAPAARPQLPTLGHSWRRESDIAPRENPWEAALDLINLGFLISHVSYLAFLQASLTVLETYNRTDPEKTS
jgi:hypothetical protein